MILLRKEVTYLKEKFRKLEEEFEDSDKVDSWARQEIKDIRNQLDSRPPTLEDAPIEQRPKTSAQLQGLSAMKILPIRFQKYQVKIKLEINSEIFCLNALLDTRSDMNLVHKDLIPHKYWFPSSYSAIGLVNVSTNMDFEIPKGILLFDEYALGMKFLLSELPVDCILGTPFLSVIEPHGSSQTSSGDLGYFITLPSINGHPRKMKTLAFISESQAQIAYCSKNMVVINTWDDYRNIPVTEYLDDHTTWEIYCQNWVPQWQLRWSEGVEFGLPGFSTNTSIHVIPPQHVIGQMHQASTIAARQKLVEI
jgi:hypothetical protein